MNHHLDRVEAQLRNLFEEKLLRVFTGGHPQHSLIADLIDAMRTNIQITPDSENLAPDQFQIHVSPDNFPGWKSNQPILDQMAESLFIIGKEEGLTFNRPPAISIHSDLSEEKLHYAITVSISDFSKPLTDTAAMTQPIENESQQLIPQDAYFVIGGTTHFPLLKPIINIGRHSDNDLTLEDLHISRHHAQLRVIRNQHVIFDVGSTGGIFLNGQQVSQATLHSGDVIRIGMINLIYIHDTTASHATTALTLDIEDNSSGETLREPSE